jgi:hypothetical protein
LGEKIFLFFAKFLLDKMLVAWYNGKIAPSGLRTGRQKVKKKIKSQQARRRYPLAWSGFLNW